MRTPKPRQWRSDTLSQRYIADYKPFVFVDGEGVRCSLYVSGCLFACDGCFNQSTWNFRYGTPYTAELGDRIIEDLRQPYVQGLTLLGGEPFLNTGVCLELVRRVRAEFGDSKDIWSWSGYTYEQLLLDTDDKVELLRGIDVLVDGPFEIGKKDLGLRFRGSSNQRVIDVASSLRTGNAVPYFTPGR
ncbi:ribonucleoside-triphosphate reductase class III activase subunit [Glaciihabitans tibetensis]|uniref:Anaerobic ribonucleoside-triphosphate reductase-activating protein n=1 Tax=Glaciihabitans tibetensis TaxID=1266600 RepID=A0A2T0VCG6_9MICO|nr:anaerobic ribonucleoside-triphosphate reductase activating protein [Glaciihabitans tibetensis]PRY67876.1 ribonucleoside-triphosphate reductase class III activase subunit [Glaciihabitans tibetensis]